MHITTETRVGIFVLIALALFAYMTLQIGVFRFDRLRYHQYTIKFRDVSGLSRKTEVKIAGVKVGWVDAVKLTPDEKEVDVIIMVDRRYVLHKDAYGLIRQDGLLGNKYLEIITGDPLQPVMSPGSRFTQEGPEVVSVDQLMRHLREIALNVEDVTTSLKTVFGGESGVTQLRDTVNNINHATAHLATFSNTIDRILSSNEENLNSIMGDIRTFTNDLKAQFPTLSDDIHRLAAQLDTDIFPTLKNSLKTISGAVDRDFNRVANKLETTAESLDEAALQVRDGFKNFSDVAQKINEGRGLIGKLVNEEDTYRDLKVAISGIKNYLAKLDSLGVIIDAHGESLQQPQFPYRFQNAKGYFNIRLHPNEDHFWLVGAVGSTLGYVERRVKFRRWFNERGCQLVPEDLHLTDRDKLRFAFRREVVKQHLDSFTFNAQFGKIFNNIAVRFGVFESTAGFAVDYDIPFRCANFRWVTSLEAWDFRGRMRIADDRAHLKWINYLFYTRNLYFCFGADDFISKRNKNAFFGFGIRFADDDIKYLLSRVNVNT